MIPLKKLLNCSALALLILIFLSQCKLHAPKDEVASTPVDTSAITIIDTSGASVPGTIDTTQPRMPLTLIISNLISAKAQVVVGVYGEINKFPDPKGQLKVYSFKPDSISLTATITDLPFGIYALAIYQDVNSNGKIDKNLIGIPTEPYAFSNNYKPTVKAPAFKNCRFEYSAANHAISMKMIR